MARTSLRRCLLGIIVLAFAPTARAADVARPEPDATHEIIRYKAPAGWKVVDQPGQPTKVYQSPDSTPANQAFIVIAATPAQAGMDFPKAFDALVKGTVSNATITQSNPAAATKTRQGFDALSQTVVAKNPLGQQVYLRTVGAKVNDRMAAFGLLASSKELYDKHQADMDALLQSVSFTDAPAAAPANANPEWAALEDRKQKLLKEVAEIEAKQAQLTGGAPTATAQGAAPTGNADAKLKHAMDDYTKSADARRKPNTIVGDILTLDGKPIANVVSYTLYCGGTSIAGERTRLNLEVDERGHFEQKLPEGLYKIYATCIVNYAGHRVPVDLVSLDGKPMGVNQDSAKGLVKDFRLVIGGLKPGEAPDGVNAFFGGAIGLADGSPDIEHSLKDRFPGSKIRLTLTPAGPLVDGSTGAPVPIEVDSAQTRFGAARVQNIPLGAYRATAALVLPNGQTKPLGLSTSFAGPFQSPFDLFWTTGEGDPSARSEPRLFLRD
jgi:hypothetical protein